MKELSLKQNLLWNTTGCLIYQGCQWLTTILVVILSPSYENSGILAFAMATGNIYVGLATYNMRTFQVSDIVGEYSSNNYIAFRIVTVLLATVVCVSYSFIVAPGIATGIAMAAYLLFKADESFVNVLYGMDQKAGRMDFIGISQGIRGILTISAFSATLVVSGDLTSAFIAMFICCVLVTLFYDVPHSRKLGTVKIQLTKTICFNLFKTCAPNVIATFAYGAVATLARQWFGLTYGEEALGIYSAVATPCVLVQVMANYLYSPFLVPIARSWTRRDKQTLNEQLKKLLLGVVAVIAACITVSVIAGTPAIELLYGSSIEGYSWMIVPAMVAASFMALDSLLTDLLIVMKRYLLAAEVNIAALITCAALMSPMTSICYMNGINLVIIISFAVAIVFGILALAISGKNRAK